MKRERFEMAAPVVVSGIIVSVGLAVILFFFVEVEAQTSFAIGLIGIVISLQIEIIVLMQRRYSVEDLRSELLSAVESNAELLPMVSAIVKAATAVMTSNKHPAYPTAAKEALHSTLNRLRQLEGGHLRREVGDTTIMTQEMRTAKRSVMATTFLRIDADWWLSEGGRQYLQENRQAAERSLEIERICFYDEWKDSYDEVVAVLQDAGVRVMRLQSNRVPSRLRRNIVIFDESMYIEDVVNAEGEVVEFVHVIDSTAVEEAARDFASLRNLSELLVQTA
jgi:hypothetical protein